MKMYDIGKRYRWYREVGELAHLNGTECTIIGEPQLLLHPGGWPAWAQETDSLSPWQDGLSTVVAMRGDLLPLDDSPTETEEAERANAC